MDWKDDEYEDLLRRFQPRRPGVPRGMLPSRTTRRRSLWLAAAAAAILLGVVSVSIIRNQSRIDAHAIVETADGSLYRMSGGSTQVLHSGERIQAGDVVHANGGEGAVVVLTDGSSVEMRSRSEFSLEPADDGVRIHLTKGSIIVNAAEQRKGHLCVQTKEVTVSVVGTVFLVNAEEEGSRVAVIHGEVRVEQGELSKKLLPGEQVMTNPLMESKLVREEISWSRNAEAHLALLQQSAVRPPAIAAQNPPQTSEMFEVASVRAVDPAQDPGSRGILGALPCRGTLQVDPGRFVASRMTLYRLIALGYGKYCPRL